MEQTLARVLKGWCVLCAIIVCVATFAIGANRFFIKVPAPWIDELAMMAMLYITFIAGALAVRENSHIRIDIMPMFLHGRKLELGRLAITILTATALVLFSYLSWGHLWYLIKSGQQLPGFAIPWAWGYAAIPIGTALMVLYAIMVVIAHTKRGTPGIRGLPTPVSKRENQ